MGWQMSSDKYRRKKSTLSIRNKVLILCSGETEERYFKFIKNKKRLTNVSVDVAINKKSDPLGVVNAAIVKKCNFDEVWAVFDKDDFTDFDKAITLASNNDVKCAFSNEAIEYWFLLHFKDTTAAQSRKSLNKDLSKNLGFKYDKDAQTLDRTFKAIAKHHLQTEERARIGHERRTVDTGGNPSNWCSCTTIYLLTKRLREWSEA